jgi:UDP-N-acetylmuramate dehydrogenase
MGTFNDLKQKLGERVKENEPVGKYTTFKIGGPADFFFDAKSTDDLVRAVLAGRSLHIPVFLLGGGTNILVGDKGIRGLVIRNGTRNIRIRGAKGGRTAELVFVEAESGVVMNQLVRFTIEEGLAGLEMQLGLPGSVGGAVFMNSKWTHPVGYVGDAVYQAKILTSGNTVKEVPKSYFQFAYDSSVLQKTREIVLSVVFALHKKDKDMLWKIANESVLFRHETQPQGVHSPGCTFRNISNATALSVPTPNHTTSAGFLIDHSGCKGMHAGDAFVSDIHANFIINKGVASAADVVQLIEKIRAKVNGQFGVKLEEEIVRVGEF